MCNNLHVTNKKRTSFTLQPTDNILAPTVFESSMSEVGKSVAKRTAATDTGGILVSALRQEPAQNSDIEGGCGGLSLHPGES